MLSMSRLLCSGRRKKKGKKQNQKRTKNKPKTNQKRVVKCRCSMDSTFIDNQARQTLENNTTQSCRQSVGGNWEVRATGRGLNQLSTALRAPQRMAAPMDGARASGGVKWRGGMDHGLGRVRSERDRKSVV